MTDFTYNIVRWFLPSFWKYLFEGKKDKWSDGMFWKLRRAWCRARGHPYGVVWYNPNGFEPDMTCKNCGEDLG